MDRIDRALKHISRSISEKEHRAPVSYEEFIKTLTEHPRLVIRNIFQIFHDMVLSKIQEGPDEFPEDLENIHFAPYDCTRLFVQNSDHPFFADRLFANRLISLVESLKRGTQQNKVYIFEGPPGSGKSTFLNNLLMKLEDYVNAEEGTMYETVWRIDRKLFGEFGGEETMSLIEQLSQVSNSCMQLRNEIDRVQNSIGGPGSVIEVPCPSHDHPILMIPKAHRREFFDYLFFDNKFKDSLFSKKEYAWVFKNVPCTICTSFYDALLKKFNNPMDVLKMVYARPYTFNRRLGEGISVLTPGDKPLKQTVLTNDILQNRINDLLRDSNLVKYIFSRYAKTNNGVYALMDIKSHNVERFIELHNIISEGVHKVEYIEENVNSLFIALMNPEDKANIEEFQSFTDRIEYIKIPYVLDLNTEIEIYKNIFGPQIDLAFLPRVLHNFARVIISSRLRLSSDALVEWIDYPTKYRQYCDDNLQLLKMELYTGNIPKWLTEADRKKLTAKRRRRIIAESENEGRNGFSGRDSIKIFNDFYSRFARKDKLIDMSMVCNYFTKVRQDLGELIPPGFLESLTRNYNYAILQEVKEALYNYNKQQIAREVKNYLFAVNFEPGTVETSTYTGDRLEITEAFFENMEERLMGLKVEEMQRRAFREDVQREYTTRTLTQEIMSEGKTITETELFAALRDRYVYNLKEKVLDPFMDNENFRRAVKDFGKEDFKTYDKKIRDDVSYLMNNLCEKFNYTKIGAKDVCMYVIDNELAREFGT